MLLMENFIVVGVLELGANSNSLISFTIAIFVVINANLMPMQILGPSPLNKYC